MAAPPPAATIVTTGSSLDLLSVGSEDLSRPWTSTVWEGGRGGGAKLQLAMTMLSRDQSCKSRSKSLRGGTLPSERICQTLYNYDGKQQHLVNLVQANSPRKPVRHKPPVERVDPTPPMVFELSAQIRARAGGISPGRDIAEKLVPLWRDQANALPKRRQAPGDLYRTVINEPCVNRRTGKCGRTMGSHLRVPSHRRPSWPAG